VPALYPHDPKPLPYLQDDKDNNYDMSLEVKLNGTVIR
jgi:hypothetical protein